jgi:hypothetical protein
VADAANGCCVNLAGDVFIVGETASFTGIATPGAFQTVLLSNVEDAFLVKFDLNGVRQWGTYYGSYNSDNGYSCCSDKNGNLYICGDAASVNQISTPGAHQQVLNGNSDAMLVKFWECTSLNIPGSINGPTGVCVGSPATSFSIAAVSGATSYLWVAPPGWTGTSTTNIISAAPGTSGVFSVAATNTCAPSISQTLNVIVDPLPTITVNSGTMCSGQSFTINPSGASTYTYQGGNQVVSPTISATYTVIGSSLIGCISSSPATSSVTVNPAPTISVNSGAICLGQTFTIVPSGGSSYTIQGGNFIVGPGSNTSYTVVGTNSLGCISPTYAISNVTVNPNPIVTVNNGSVCLGQSFTLVPTGANTYTFEGGSAIVTPTNNTSYTVTGTSTAGCEALGPATSNVTVYPVPSVSVNFGGICIGQTLTLIANGANNWLWNTGATSQIISVSPTITSNYTVTGFDLNLCSNTQTTFVDVHNLPVVNAVSNPSFICIGQSATLTASGATTYSWSTGNLSGSFVISPTITTSYTVTGTDNFNCQDTAVVTQVVDLCNGIDQIDTSPVTISIYPNPNNGNFVIEYSEESKITIYNSLGQIIIEEKNSGSKKDLSLKGFSNGIYFVRVSSQDKDPLTVRIIKDE